uniref:Neprosin PEP catalytic domain-containing protein n=1 Tax=Oryza punctata TaxID=4537 RepID=A0A0E0LES1_ORYPU
MATILFVGVLLMSCCFLLLSSASGNGTIRPVFSMNQARKCGAMGGTARCKEIVDGYIIVDGSIFQSAGYITNGFIATMDVYGFPLSPGQIVSYGSVRIITDNVDDPVSNLEVIQIGWRVEPGDERPVFDLYCNIPLTWTKTALVFNPGSAQTYVLTILSLDIPSGNWMVHYGFNRDPDLIGRIPMSYFSTLSYSATNIWFGGMVVTNATFQPTPPPLPMGSRYMAADNGKMAASMKNLQLIDEQGRAWSAENDLVGFSTKEDVYTFTPIVGDQFFYGGPFQLTSLGTMSRTNAVYSFLLVLFFYYLFS